MHLKAAIIPLTLSFVLQGEAFLNFGSIIKDVANTIKGVDAIFKILPISSKEFITYDLSCGVSEFKAKSIGVNALCQQEDNIQAIQICKEFGVSCVETPGKWGCGRLDSGERGCLFRPVSRTLNMPNVIFDDEASEYEKEWRRTRPYQVGWRAYQRSNYSTLQDDEPEPGYKDLNDYFGKVLIANVKRYEETYDDGFERMDASFGDVDEQMLAGLSVDAIVKLLDKAGIRYPIGQKVCQICKGTCNRILSGANRDRCKYDACVKFLGGYRGNEASPSCTKIPLP